MSAKPGPEMQERKYDTVLQFVREKDCPFVTTREVSEEFPGVSRKTIQNRLYDLVDDDRLKRRDVGANTAVWFIGN